MNPEQLKPLVHPGDVVAWYRAETEKAREKTPKIRTLTRRQVREAEQLRARIRWIAEHYPLGAPEPEPESSAFVAPVLDRPAPRRALEPYDKPACFKCAAVPCGTSIPKRHNRQCPERGNRRDRCEQ